MSKVLGIDLGTTNSVVAVANGKEARVLQDADGRRLVPSVVSFHPDGSILVGHEARERRLVDAANTVYSTKRLIGRPFASTEVQRARERFAFALEPTKVGGVQVRVRRGTFALPEISAMVLRHLRRLAEDSLGEPCARAVITVPANFNELQRSATQAAGKVAGLEVLRILNEPTAATLAYGLSRDRAEKVAVYDLGGGTFDITILDLDQDVYEVVSTAGDTFLGGDDVDLLVAEKMAETCLREHRFDARADAQAFERMRAAAEWAKCQLSSVREVDVTLEELFTEGSGASVDFSFHLTRAELEQMIRPLVARTFDVVNDALRAAGRRPKEIDSVVLVGGSTRIPLVRAMVEEFFGKPPRIEIDPDLVVAQGAAIHGFTIAGSKTAAAPAKALARVALKKMTKPVQAIREERLPRQPAFAPEEGRDDTRARVVDMDHRAPVVPAPRPVTQPGGALGASPLARAAARLDPRREPPKAERTPSASPPNDGLDFEDLPTTIGPRPELAGRAPTEGTVERAVETAFGGSPEPSRSGAEPGPSPPVARGRTIPGASHEPSLGAVAPRPSPPRGAFADRPLDRAEAPAVPVVAVRAVGVGEGRSWPHNEPRGEKRADLPEPQSAPSPAKKKRQPTMLGVLSGPDPKVAEPNVLAPPASKPLAPEPPAPEPPAPVATPLTTEAPLELSSSAFFVGDLDAAFADTSGKQAISPASPNEPDNELIDLDAPLDIASPKPFEEQFAPLAPRVEQPPPVVDLAVPMAPPAPTVSAAPPPVAAPPPLAPRQPVIAMPSRSAPLLMDVTPLSLGIETVGGFCQPIVARNAPIPTEKSRIFATARDDQTEVEVKICQGESNRFEENQALGALVIGPIRRAPRGDVRIEVTFMIDQNGILDVKATDLDAKRAQGIRIALRGGAETAELEAMRQRQEALFSGS